MRISKIPYNMISVDGDTSTNDTVLLLANGYGRKSERLPRKMRIIRNSVEALNYVNTTLAKKIAGDGEGATALFEVKVIGAESKGTGSDLKQNPLSLQVLTKGSYLRT